MSRLLTSLVILLSLYGQAAADSVVMVGFGSGSGGGGGTVLAGNTTAPSGTAGYNANTNYWCDFTASASGTLAKGYLYVKNGYDRYVKMFVHYGGTCYYSSPVYMDYRTNQWVEFTFTGGPAITSGGTLKIGFIASGGVDIGEDSGAQYVGYQSDSYASPGCNVGSPSYYWNKYEGWYITD